MLEREVNQRYPLSPPSVHSAQAPLPPAEGPSPWIRRPGSHLPGAPIFYRIFYRTVRHEGLFALTDNHHAEKCWSATRRGMGRHRPSWDSANS